MKSLFFSALILLFSSMCFADDQAQTEPEVRTTDIFASLNVVRILPMTPIYDCPEDTSEPCTIVEPTGPVNRTVQLRLTHGVCGTPEDLFYDTSITDEGKVMIKYTVLGTAVEIPEGRTCPAIAKNRTIYVNVSAEGSLSEDDIVLSRSLGHIKL